MSPRRVLVLNLGWEQMPLIEELARPERGLELYGVHHDATTVPLIGFREVLIAPMRDLARIIGFADRIRPDAVISDECDYALFAQAVLARRFGLPGPNMLAAQRSNNKLLQRQTARAGGLLVPDFTQCLTAEDVARFGENTGWPIIVKPADNRGSFGVSVVRNASEAFEAHTKALVNSHSRLVLAERFVHGVHLTIDGYCVPGQSPSTLALAMNLKFGGGDGTVNESIIYPADLDARAYEEAWGLAARTASTLDYDFGFFHGEFIIEQNTDRIFLTEMSNRGGGVNISNVAVPFSSGINVTERLISDALGMQSKLTMVPAAVPNPVMLRFFASDLLIGRRLHTTRGLDAIKQDPGVLACRLFVAAGSVFSRLENGADRHGMIIVGSDRREKLEAMAANVVRQLEIEAESEQG